MWALLIILGINGGILSGGHLAMTTINGFSSKETCEQSADQIKKDSTKDGVFATRCIEVK
jgi:hypothetical protein